MPPKKATVSPTLTKRDGLTAQIGADRKELKKQEILRLDPTLTPQKRAGATKRANSLRAKIQKDQAARDKLTNRLKQERKNAALAAKKAKQPKKGKGKGKGKSGGSAPKKPPSPPPASFQGMSVVRSPGQATRQTELLQTPMLAPVKTATSLAGPVVKNHPTIQNGGKIVHLWIEDQYGTKSGSIASTPQTLESDVKAVASQLGFKKIFVFVEIGP